MSEAANVPVASTSKVKLEDVPPQNNAVTSAKASTASTPSQVQQGPQQPPRRPRSKILRFLGINFKTLAEFAPSRKTAGRLAVIASPLALYLYDRRIAAQILEEHKRQVSHLADAPLPADDAGEETLLQYPKKVWVMTSRVPDDFEDDRAYRWFKYYVKPVLHAAGYDWSFLNGSSPGALGRRVRDTIRLERIESASPQPQLRPGEMGYLEYIDKRRHTAGLGLTVVIGRNTFKEYLWGLKQGWLTDFDAVQVEKGDEGETQALMKELASNDVFKSDPPPGLASVEASMDDEPNDGHDSDTPDTPPSQQSLFPSRNAYTFFSKQPSIPAPISDEPERQLIIPAASQMPVQPPLLFLPFNHPLGYLRYWPGKMVRYLFCERYRMQAGCDTALAIIKATNDAYTSSATEGASEFASFEPEDSSAGLRPIRPPKVPESMTVADYEKRTLALEDVVTENRKRVLPDFEGDVLPETGSQDLDADRHGEWLYRKSFTETPVNLLKNRKEYYAELPQRLTTARELARRDRLPTKEEGKYPPATEPELVKERLNKEKKWRADFEGWLMTRVGSPVPWDSRFESLKVLDLELAKENMRKAATAKPERGGA